MDPLEIIAQFSARSRSARNYREVGLLLLVVSIIVFALYAVNRARIEFWGGIILAAGIILLVVAFALAMLSFLKVRCPNCSRVLGEVHGAAFCPSCGVPLKDDGSFIRAPIPSAKPRRAAAAGRAIVRRDWEPRSLAAAGDEFPEEAYPKNIRMFTTTDETELTKRYIRLIGRDDRNLEKQGSGALSARPDTSEEPPSRPEDDPAGRNQRITRSILRKILR
jgi:uncharacterized Zn finger protein (UPF0148 family)